MIRLVNINKVYNKGKNNETQALKKIDMTVEKGDFLAVVGTSGAGKSTLLKIIGGIEVPTKGEYYFNDKKVNFKSNKECSELRKKDIGFVLQDFGLVENENVLSNVMLPLYFSKFKGSKKEAAEKVLSLLNIKELASKKVNQLSGGQKQRVAICRALVNDPEVIIADEPTGALDNKTSGEIIKLLAELNKKGKTIIIVTHDMNIANCCKRKIQISDGSIIDDSIIEKAE